MSETHQDLPAQVVVLCSADGVEAVVGRSVMHFCVDLGDVRNVAELNDAMSAELMFPHEAVGLDALLDLLSDLDWFAHDEGYVLEVVGLDRLEQRDGLLLERLARLIPFLCNRWRNRNTAFRVVLRSNDQTRSHLKLALMKANDEIASAASQPWVADLERVEVLDCSHPLPGSTGS